MCYQGWNLRLAMHKTSSLIHTPSLWSGISKFLKLSRFQNPLVSEAPPGKSATPAPISGLQPEVKPLHSVKKREEKVTNWDTGASEYNHKLWWSRGCREGEKKAHFKAGSPPGWNLCM